jgi:nucleoside-diphosphate-sugar epimerase
MTNHIHIIFGTGPLAKSVMRALQIRNKSIRMVNRSGKRDEDIPEEVEIVAGNAYNSDFTRTVTSGAEVVYQCAQPAYHEWVQKFPFLQAAILEGAAANTAKLIVGENTYMYGDTNGAILTENLPNNAHTRKGQVRAEMTATLFSAHRAGKVQVATARGSDFFGPGVLGSVVGERVFATALQGKKAQFTGKMDIPHTFTFIDDFGEAMAVLGERKDALGQAWHVPNDQPTITQREFGELMFQAAGLPPKMSSMGKWMMRMGGIFIPEAKEVVEMMYEFEKPFVVDSGKFENTFQIKGTPIREGVRRTVEWYRAKPQLN